MMSLALLHSIVLFALPLSLLPLMTSFFRPGGYAWTVLIPADPLSSVIHWGLKLIGVVAVAALLLGLGGLHRVEQVINHIGKGAHIVLLLDRSSSMDQSFAGTAPSGDNKSKSAASRRILSDFVSRRDNDLFGVAAFSTSAIFVLPLSAHRDATLAAIRAIDRPGLAFTHIAKGLAMALSYFDGQAHTGSRVIMLVSDGAAVIDHRSQAKLRKWFEKQRANLYWVFIRTQGSRGIFDQPVSAEDDRPAIMPERHLHKFFSSLKIPYQAFEADNAQSLEQAIGEIDRLENLPLRYAERIPRKDLSGFSFVIAVCALAFLIAGKMMEVRVGR